MAKRRACYDGAMGARGIQEFRSFGAEGSKTLYDNNTYTITSTYQNGNLKIYTTHPVPSTDPERSEYHMTHLGGWDLTGSRDQFQVGASALRNARDWARAQRDGLIATANGRVLGMPRETPTLGSSGPRTALSGCCSRRRPFYLTFLGSA